MRTPVFFGLALIAEALTYEPIPEDIANLVTLIFSACMIFDIVDFFCGILK